MLREHHRLLGNGYRTRSAELDCAFESICETCTFFQASIEFQPTLQAQHEHAATHGQHEHAATHGQRGRQQLFLQFVRRIDKDAS